MNKTIVAENGSKIGTLTPYGVKDINGHVVGCVAFYGGKIGHVSFCRTIGGMTSGKLIPFDNNTVKLSR